MDFSSETTEEKNNWSVATIVIVTIVVLGALFFLTFEVGVQTGREFTSDEKIEILNKLSESKSEEYSIDEKNLLLESLTENADKSITLEEKNKILNSLR